MRGKWLWLGIAAVALGVVVGALSMRRQRIEKAAAAPSGALVIPQPEVTITGVIRPQHVTGVGSPISGSIEAFAADVGDQVFQGQVLARIGTSNLETDRESAAHAVETAQDQVAKAETAVNSARQEEARAAADAQRSRMTLDRTEKVYTRQKTLHAAGATPRMVYERAEQEYEAAVKEFEIMDKAARAASDNVKSTLDRVTNAKKELAEKNQQLEEAQAAYEAAEVRAPIDGLVVGRKGEVGKPAEESGQELFTIATDVYALEVVLEPKAEIMKRLHQGQPVLVSVLDLQTGGIPGTVKEIKDKNGQVIVEFGSTMPAIRPGMKADVRFKLE